MSGALTLDCLPEVVLEKVLSYFTYDEIAKHREVSLQLLCL